MNDLLLLHTQLLQFIITFNDYDFSGLVEAATDFLTVFLVTLPTYFIDATLSSGVIRSIWTALFGNANIVKIIFIFLIIGGPLIMAKNWKNTNINNRGRSKL